VASQRASSAALETLADHRVSGVVQTFGCADHRRSASDSRECANAAHGIEAERSVRFVGALKSILQSFEQHELHDFIDAAS
jgi:hypothetical protein